MWDTCIEALRIYQGLSQTPYPLSLRLIYL